MLFFFVFCFPDHCLYLICKAYCNSRWLINCDFFLLKSALKKNLYSWISHKSLKKKRVNSAPTSQKSRLRAECLFRKMPPRCEFRRPRFFFFFAVIAWLPQAEAHSARKTCLMPSGLASKRRGVYSASTCSGSCPNSQTKWSLKRAALWKRDAEWSSSPSHCLRLCRDSQPRILLRLLVPLGKTFQSFHQVSHLPQLRFCVTSATSAERRCNHAVDQKKELLLNGSEGKEVYLR